MYAARGNFSGFARAIGSSPRATDISAGDSAFFGCFIGAHLFFAEDFS